MDKLPLLMTLVIVISLLGMGWALFLTGWVLKQDTGTEAMQMVSNAIKEGAEAFLKRMNRTIFLIAIGVAFMIFLMYGFLRPTTEHDPAGAMYMAVWTTFSFALGALCSVIAGYIGMWV